MKRLLIQFTQRDAHPAIQFIKYGIAGGIATATHQIIFFSLALTVLPAMGTTGLDAWLTGFLGVEIDPLPPQTVQLHYVINNVIGFVIANFVAYFINFHWVFHPGRHSRTIEVTLFFIVSIVSFLVGTLIGVMIMQVMGGAAVISQVCNIFAAVMINYVCRKYIVFKG